MTTAPTAIADTPRHARRTLRPSPSFARFLLRRAAAFVLLAIGITFVVFVLTRLIPSNAAAMNLGQQAAGDQAAVQTCCPALVLAAFNGTSSSRVTRPLAKSCTNIGGGTLVDGSATFKQRRLLL